VRYENVFSLTTLRATDPPTEKILDRKPTPRRAPLFTITMWKMIIGQAIYQLAVTLVLYFTGGSILGYDLNDSQQQLELNTIVFNTFVWMQIFNEFNNRRLDNRFNIFEGIWNNYWFLGINTVMIGGQITIIFVGGVALSVTPLDGLQWAICVICAIFCLPWAIFLRLIPDKHFAVVFNFVVNGMAFIFGLFTKVFAWIATPLSNAVRAVRLPVKRFGTRFIHKEQTTHTTGRDEEAVNLETATSGSPAVVEHSRLPPVIVTNQN
jgi:P-type Ca2+ transporter type 2C